MANLNGIRRIVSLDGTMSLFLIRVFVFWFVLCVGVEEARNGGRLVKAEGLQFDAAYTSCLKRAIKTLFLTLEESDQLWIPVTKTWRLNERHYGALTGLNKQETVNKHGIEQVSFCIRLFDANDFVLHVSLMVHSRRRQLLYEASSVIVFEYV